MKTAVEIYKLLPKTNCGKCGLPRCMGFAAKLASHQAKTEDCPAMTASAREALRETETSRNESPGTVYEQVLNSLRPKVRALDFRRTASFFGATLAGPDALSITFLNEQYTVTKERVLDASGNE